MKNDKKPEKIINLKAHLITTKTNKNKQIPKYKKINLDIVNQFSNSKKTSVTHKKIPFFPMKTDINQKNLLYSGNTYRQKFTNNKIYNATEISQSTLKHINVSTADKIYIKENNRKNSLPKKNVISVKRNFYKSKVKTPITNYNKEKKGTSINIKTNYNKTKNINKKSDIINNNDLTDNEELNNSLHSFNLSSDKNTDDINNFHDINTSDSKTPVTTSHINTLNNETTKVYTENISDFYSSLQFLQKSSKETFDGTSILKDFIKNKNNGKNRLNKINKRPSFPNMDYKTLKQNFDDNIFCSSRRQKKLNKDNFYSKCDFLRSQNKTCRNRKLKKLNNNYLQFFSNCNSMYELKKDNIKKNNNYNYLKTIDNTLKNKGINKINSTGLLNNKNKKIPDIKLDYLTKKYNKVKMKLNLIKRDGLFISNINKKNNIDKYLYNNINNTTTDNQKKLVNFENRKTLYNSLYNDKILISQEDRKTLYNPSFIFNNSINSTNNSAENKKTRKTIKKNSKLKLDTLLPKKTLKKDIKIHPITTKEEKDIPTDVEKSPISKFNKRADFIPKEYPNMAQKIPKNKNFISSNFIKEEKTIKNINFLCKRGYSGPETKKLNQDNYFIYNNFLNNENYKYMGVCDGHGIFGQNISDYLVEHLPKNLNTNFLNSNIQNLKNENIFYLSNIIEKTFIQTNNNLNNNERIDSSLSGSTCVSIIFTNERIICINVGDSRCILGKKNSNNEFSSMNLSRDHKPCDPEEKERIINNGGIVESYRDNEGNFVGPERVWVLDGESPGLAMSRSFGDEVAHKVGVIVSPEIFDYKLLKEDLFLVIASDGVWEFISSDEVVDIVKNFYERNDVQGALDSLYREACNRWMSKEDIIDDITIIIVFF